MQIRKATLVLFMLAASLASHAYAQDTPRVGLSVGYPASVGVSWNLSPRIAIRPDVSFDALSVDSAVNSPFGEVAVSGRTWQLDVGLSTLFLLSRIADTSVYVSPRYAYVRGDRTTTSDPGYSPDDGSAIGHNVSGALGMRYDLSAQIAVFGEAGTAFERQTVRSHLPAGSDLVSRAEYTRTRLRSGVGLIFYF
jgi:hypothetical protein